MGSLFFIVCQFCRVFLFLHLNDTLFLFNEANYKSTSINLRCFFECSHLETISPEMMSVFIFPPQFLVNETGAFKIMLSSILLELGVEVQNTFFFFQHQDLFLYSKKLPFGCQCRKVSGVILIPYFLVLLTASNKSVRCGSFIF